MPYRIFILSAPAAMGVLLLFLGAVLRFRREPTAKALIVYFILVFFFLGANILELLSGNTSCTLLWTQVEHLAFSFIPVAWFSFAVSYRYSGKAVGRLPLAGLAAVPLVTAVLILTVNSHQLFYRGYEIAVHGDYSTLKPVYGPWFWISGVYKYCLLLGGVLLIFRNVMAKPGLFRGQSLMLAFGGVFPLAANMIYIFGPGAFGVKDYTPVAFALSGFFFFAGIYRYRLFQVVPVAREAVFQRIDTAVVVLDNRERVIDYNRSAQRLFSLTPSMVGRTYQESGCLSQIVRRNVLGSAGAYEAETGTSPQKRHLDVKIHSLLDSGGARRGVILSAADVSVRERLLESRLRLMSDLERNRREQERMQQQLVRQGRLASVGRMAAGMAHELRNPVGFLKSNFRVLNSSISSRGDEGAAEGEDGTDLRQLLEDCQEGLDQIDEVVTSLLLFSRSGKKREKAPYDLAEGWQRTIRIARGTMDPGIEVVRDFQEVPPIEARGDEINQVLLNLLQNAVYAVEGCLEPPRRIGIAVFADSPQWISTVITNNGPPLSQEELEHVFDPFYTTKPENEGVGLGMSLAWEIVVEGHGGTLSVESSVEETAFRIDFPSSSSPG